MKKLNIMSIDAETNGLWGNPFAIAGIIYSPEGIVLDKICLRMSDSVVTDTWVKENVLPTLDFPITHSSNNFFDQFGRGGANRKAYESMLKDFSTWYMKHKEGSEVLYHMGHIVEAHVFRELHRLDFIGDWDAPYTPIEVSEILRQKGFSADSVDGYAKEFNLEIADYGSTHNPLYDCEVAYKVYQHLTK